MKNILTIEKKALFTEGEKEKEKEKKKLKDAFQVENPKIFQIDYRGTDRIIQNPSSLTTRYYFFEYYGNVNPLVLNLPLPFDSHAQGVLGILSFDYKTFCVNESYTQFLTIDSTNIDYENWQTEQRYNIASPMTSSIHTAVVSSDFVPQTGSYSHKEYKYNAEFQNVRFYVLNLQSILNGVQKIMTLDINDQSNEKFIFTNNYYISLCIKLI